MTSIKKIDFRTDAEKLRDADHDRIKVIYKTFAQKMDGAKNWTICRAVSVATISEGMKGGKGYTAQAIKYITK